MIPRTDKESQRYWLKKLNWIKQPPAQPFVGIAASRRRGRLNEQAFVRIMCKINQHDLAPLA
jgi:hypothetical protein